MTDRVDRHYRLSRFRCTFTYVLKTRVLALMVVSFALWVAACGDDDVPAGNDNFSYSTIPVFGSNQQWSPAHETPIDTAEAIGGDTTRARRIMILPTTEAPTTNPAGTTAVFTFIAGSERPGYGIVQAPGISLEVIADDGSTIVELVSHPDDRLVVCPTGWIVTTVRSYEGCREDTDRVALRWDEDGDLLSAVFDESIEIDVALSWLETWRIAG
jgi:hypothetical protein